MNQTYSQDSFLSFIENIFTSSTGITFDHDQRNIILLKIEKHIRSLGLPSFQEYEKYFLKHPEQEKESLISILTVHHTSFFRNISHFNYIEQNIHDMVRAIMKSGRSELSVWSSACSFGHEVYSLALLLDYHLRRYHDTFTFRILGSDVDTLSLKIAQNGVYRTVQAEKIPGQYHQNHIIYGTGNAKGYIKISDKLKRKCHFKKHNLISDSMHDMFDLIFCRNVLIYFSESMQQEAISKMAKNLYPNGIIILGSSESLFKYPDMLESIGDSKYKIRDNKTKSLNEHEHKKNPNVYKLISGSQPSSFINQDTSYIAVLCKHKERMLLFRVHDIPSVSYDIKKAIKNHSFENYSVRYIALEREEKELRKKLLLSFDQTTGVSVNRRFDLNVSGRIFRTHSLIQENNQIKQNIKEKQEIITTTQERKIRVLVVDDSKTNQLIMKKLLPEMPGIEWVGEVLDPRDFSRISQELKPDVITLDMNMPHMNGCDILRQMKQSVWIPAIIVSSLGMEEGSAVFEALELGAFDYIQKPEKENLVSFSRLLEEKIRFASQHNRRSKKQHNTTQLSRTKIDLKKIIAIGSSTGGPTALKELLSSLTGEIPPIVIVQHIPPEFSRVLAERFNHLFPFTVREATDGDVLAANNVYIAPGGRQMYVTCGTSGKIFLKVKHDPPYGGFCPSVDVLFSSVADCLGKKAVGILLTGMGSDGAEGMAKMKRKGALTIAQSEESCVVFGMPKAAIALGAADKVCDISDIIPTISKLQSGS
ncbi:MAG: chemotaxis-specific protein-glutamate methyltransferase CheB [Deltaproteobacteria bacterium]|nr:chemotaxis-specific protein-glutamate methyltransferase CheB [Deltaproteobacteria bacterium]